jgi:hypothetical protein
MSFVRSIYRWLTGGKPLAALPIIELRHDLCEACPHRRRGWLRWFCDLCSCTLSRRRTIFNKLAHGDQQCPIKRW